MTKAQAILELISISSGTLANLTGYREYEKIDAVLAEKIAAIDRVDVSDCTNWQSLWLRLLSA